MSPEINELATALAKAQGEMGVAGKNQKNLFYKSAYADFEAIVEASRPSLSRHGLSVVQPPVVQEDGKSYLITILMHSSGQWIKSKALHNPPKQNDAQALSSYNTYLKRMCYTSLVGVVTGDHDDDGNATIIDPNSPLTQQEIDHIEKSLSAEQKEKFLNFYKLNNLKELKYWHYEKAVETLEKKK